jgi:hypothetical protein
MTIPWPPVIFAWAASTETTFGSQHYRFDEEVLALNMTHSEGNFPTCDVTIKNPYRPFVVTGSTWVWLAKARDTDGTYVPFFFGRLVATPDNLEAEALVLKFIARSSTWLKLKQHQADLNKDYPYDPIFVSADKRGDPDPVLEFRSAVWHFDRVPTAGPATPSGPDLQVSLSDILMAEDGWLTFAQQDHFYDSFNWQIGQQPLKTVQIKAKVNWIQYAAGRVDMQPGNNEGYTANSVVQGWPKAGTALQGGYTVASATAFSTDEFASSMPRHLNWENQQQDHIEGDTMTLQENWTEYNCGGTVIRYNISSQSGLVDSGASTQLTGFEDPPTGVNIPLHVEWSEMMVCYGKIFTSLILDFDAQRPRNENLEFFMNANMQPVFDDVGQPASVDTETIPVAGSDVGSPIINTKSWWTLLIAGAAIQAGTYVESTPEFVGGPLYGVAINSGGTVGATEPVWSDILGTVINDGGVHWAMVGGTLPEQFPTWRDVSDSSVTAGLIIRSQYYMAPPADIFGHPLPAPPAGTNGFQVAINNGQTGIYSDGLNGVADLNPQWPEPFFSTTLGNTTLDNTVTWLSLGNGTEANTPIDIPLGINTNSRSYFPSARGKRSIDALINIGRAHLRMRARVFKMTFETIFDRGLDMTCRVGAIVYDHRLPGGVCIGKITAYQLIMDGDRAQFICKVTAEGAAGNNYILPTSPAPSPPPPPGGGSGYPGAVGGSGGLPGGGGLPVVPPPGGSPSSPPIPPIVVPPSPGPIIIPPNPGVGVYALAGLFLPGVQQMTGGTSVPGVP